MKRQPIIKNINNYIYDAITPINIDYWYNIGSILGLMLVIQIITGLILSMYYVAKFDLAYDSVMHIKKEINYGYLIQNIHSNGAFMFFFMLYLHIARSLIYGSYTYNKIGTWYQGILILLLMIITAFLGYSLPLGNMSLWAIAVITNLLTILPYGHDIVNYIYGGFTINDSTIGRFYTLHYLLPFIIAILAIGHLITIHNKGGSNQLGLNAIRNIGGIRFHPYYIFKDLLGYFILLLFFFYLVFYHSDYFNHSDNFIEANPLVTPPHIVPEIYLLPFYSILRAIPNKTLGVLALLSAILILAILPIIHLGIINTIRLRPIYKYILYIFFINFLLLVYTGGSLLEEPFITMSQIFTLFYFSYFIIFTPLISFFESFIFYSYKYYQL
jgi:ubiquinol-cytochrome c reductase cytochrome b subunit